MTFCKHGKSNSNFFFAIECFDLRFGKEKKKRKRNGGINKKKGEGDQ